MGFRSFVDTDSGIRSYFDSNESFNMNDSNDSSGVLYSCHFIEIQWMFSFIWTLLLFTDWIWIWFTWTYFGLHRRDAPEARGERRLDSQDDAGESQGEMRPACGWYDGFILSRFCHHIPSRTSFQTPKVKVHSVLGEELMREGSDLSSLSELTL